MNLASIAREAKQEACRFETFRPVSGQKRPGAELPCKPRVASNGQFRDASMFHPNTERLIEYWRARKVNGASPARASINPGEFADLIPQVFILGRDASGSYPFRLVGGFVAELHNRDLRGDNVLELWTRDDRLAVQARLEIARAKAEPAVIPCDIDATGVASVGMEVAFLPLTTTGGEANRFLGLYQPVSMIQRLQGRPADQLSIRRAAEALGDHRPALRLVALEGRRLG